LARPLRHARDPLGLRRALSGWLLPGLVAAMALLAALAIAGAEGASALAERWQRGAAAAVTVQLPDADAARTARAVDALRAMPEVAEAQPLHRVLDGWDGVPLLVAMERAIAPPLRQACVTVALPCALLVGPEGGFERAELDDLRRRAFVVPTALGPRILRAETAAVAGLAALQALIGDWAETPGG
jgi:hypothetical protein